MGRTGGMSGESGDSLMPKRRENDVITSVQREKESCHQLLLLLLKFDLERRRRRRRHRIHGQRRRRRAASAVDVIIL